MSFNALGLPKTFLEILENENYKNPYPIQEQAIPVILKGHDVLGIAQTGSGKTASYVLPVLAALKQKQGAKDRQVDVLVLVPTRELAEQVKDVFHLFEKGVSHPVKTMAIYGGVSINPQMKSLFGISVLVATPGRLLDLVDSNAVHFDKLKTLILDEADKLLNLGFKDEMNRIFALLPKKRQNLLFSATLNEKVEEIHQILLRDPVVINVAPKEGNIDQITQLAYSISEEKKGPFLRHLIKDSDMKQVLVFTASTYKADNVADKLRKNGIDAQAIHGKKSQQIRKMALQDFKVGKLRVLVATDLLARGIDIEFLPHVINYELPRSPKDYVHRIGRTGRAEATGKAITLVTPEDEHHFKVIQKKMKVSVPREDGNEIKFD
ncbi:MAG: DEAD/DEAH box helicase [Crocinitomicaceae bacterium]|jgi:ATP-dependent RNA helicase RhlE|tara:strand:+ start:6950 stop:8086 length:1137 start_codon:yes stop_codon:yes gene_type:complete